MDTTMSDVPADIVSAITPAIAGDPTTASDPPTAIPAAQGTAVADPDKAPSRKKAKKSHAGDSAAAKAAAPST